MRSSPPRRRRSAPRPATCWPWRWWAIPPCTTCSWASAPPLWRRPPMCPWRPRAMSRAGRRAGPEHLPGCGQSGCCPTSPAGWAPIPWACILATGLYAAGRAGAWPSTSAPTARWRWARAQRLITCSTAAGPAFEGAQLSCGMRAADGAIDRVEIDGDVHWHTIGEAPPRGMCGSGLVDLVAGMLDVGHPRCHGHRCASETLHRGRPASAGRRIVRHGPQSRASNWSSQATARADGPCASPSATCASCNWPRAPFAPASRF